jgi:hypothetical protein
MRSLVVGAQNVAERSSSTPVESSSDGTYAKLKHKRRASSLPHAYEAKAAIPIDILVNNAGMAAARGLDDITEEDFDRTIVINLKSVFLCTQAILPGMRARHWGRIVNISSIGARIGAGSVSVAYGASKAGVEGLTRAYALRLATSGVTKCRGTRLGRYGYGQASYGGGRRHPHPSRACRNGRRDRPGCDISCGQRLCDRSDNRGKWRLTLFLKARFGCGTGRGLGHGSVIK